MITIQRIRVRWSAAGRGAPQANARRGLDRPAMLPISMPAGEVVVHEVLADEAAGYEPSQEVLVGGPYPRGRRPFPLFTLAAGQVGRYRANFRLTGCACDPSRSYEAWVVHVSNGPVDPGRFLLDEPDHDRDDRVHLYGGSSIRPRGPARPAPTPAIFQVQQG